MNNNIHNKALAMNLDLREKCGVVCVYSKSNNATFLAARALAALQHRGLESAGISILQKKNKILTKKGMGLIPHVLTDNTLKELGESKFATSQNRYGTFGESTLNNAQPILEEKGLHQISLGHNGNLPDISNFIKDVKNKPKSTTDSGYMTRLLIEKRSKFKNWEETLINTLPKFKGAFCLAILTNSAELFAIRDPYGIRPLCIGKTDDGYIIASESVALDAIGADFIRDVAPGEITKIDSDGKIKSYFFGDTKKIQHCIFENIYFSRPDSFTNGVRVREGREKSGMLLAQRIKRKKLSADAVVPVFDSGYPAARGVARELNLPIVDAITTSHYVGRTFIKPGQKNRIVAVGTKHNVIADEVRGKRVIVVDDSGIRFTTSSILIEKLRSAGAKNISMCFASPPVTQQCDMGIDMRSKRELPASHYEKQKFDEIERSVAKFIQADDVTYLTIEDTAKAAGGVKENFYYYPFGGPHPIRDRQHAFPKLKNKITGKPKICVFASGGGSNLQQIIDAIENNEIDAEIIKVISNKRNAFALERAKKHKIPSSILEYSGKLSNSKDREKYESILIKEVEQTSPDMVILSGWMLVLGDKFLSKMTDLSIPIVNLHPALLTSKNLDIVSTSKGKIPVIRGANAIKDAFSLELPISGVTVHQIIQGDKFDVGPIIMKSEVAIKSNDTITTFEEKIHDAEYLLLPTAIKRVVHVLKQNIDVTKGDYPW